MSEFNLLTELKWCKAYAFIFICPKCGKNHADLEYQKPSTHETVQCERCGWVGDAENVIEVK